MKLVYSGTKRKKNKHQEYNRSLNFDLDNSVMQVASITELVKNAYLGAEIIRGTKQTPRL
jgi:hypothetical protein